MVANDGESSGNGAPFADEDEPSPKGSVGALIIGGCAGAACGVEIENLIEDKRAKKAQVATSTGKDAVLAVGIPTGDAILEFGRVVEKDFLSALDRPVFEDVVAPSRGVTLAAGWSGPPLWKVCGTMSAKAQRESNPET